MNLMNNEDEKLFSAGTAMSDDVKSENVIAGIIGAFLLALVGGILYFVIYQLGYIAGVCGLVTVFLSNFGYKKFSGGHMTMKGVIISIIISVVVIFLGEYFGLSYAIYDAYKEDYYITLMDAVKATPEFLREPDILGSVVKDLVIAYALGAFASIGTIRQNIGASREE